MRSSTASSVACCANKALRVRVCNFKDFKKTLTEEYLEESREARARGAWVGAMGGVARVFGSGRRMRLPLDHSGDSLAR